MRRRLARPFGQSISGSRAVSLLMLLIVLWMVFDWTRRPATWKWLADDHIDQPDASAESVDGLPHGPVLPPIEAKEELVPGPNDKDPAEAADLKKKFELIRDRIALRPGEMSVYWQLMKWSRTEPLAALRKRAAKDVAFSQLWEDPGRYRGKLVRLKLHVRRVLRYETEENPLGIKTVYEAWGWTDDSKSFPYVVVLADLPPGLKVGTDVRGEIDFTGYFFKVMAYTAFDVARGAPLLVGRARLSSSSAQSKPASSAAFMDTLLIGACCVIGFAVVFLFYSRRRKPVQFHLSRANIAAPDFDVVPPGGDSGTTESAAKDSEFSP